MPMTEASVVTVIPNTNNSFKLAVPGKMVGSISQDRATGIYGKLGQTPKMIPVKINLHTSRDRTDVYTYEVANDKFLTPLLLNMTDVQHDHFQRTRPRRIDHQRARADQRHRAKAHRG